MKSKLQKDDIQPKVTQINNFPGYKSRIFGVGRTGSVDQRW